MSPKMKPNPSEESAKDLEIRIAGPGDAAILSELNADVQKLHAEALPHLFKPPSGDTFPPEMAAEWISQPANYFFIGRAGGVDIGYIFVEIRSQIENSFRRAMDMVYIHHISIRPEYRQMGYGGELMEAAKSLARQKGIATLALDVWSFNRRAQAFFAAQGFANYNERMWLDLSDDIK